MSLDQVHILNKFQFYKTLMQSISDEFREVMGGLNQRK